MTKLNKLKQKIREYKEQMKRSLNQIQDQYTARREERKQNAFPTITNRQTFIVLRIYNCILKLPSIVNTVTSRITSSHAKQSKMLVSPLVPVYSQWTQASPLKVKQDSQ